MNLEEQEHVDLFQTVDAFGQSPLKFNGSEVNAKASTMYEDAVPSNFIQDGDTIVRLNVIDGYLQSGNFITGSTGWRIDSDGNVEFNNGTFRGSLSAATGTLGSITIASGGNIKFGKTAYTDDTNAGMWLGDVSGTAKFNIGSSATKYFHYDGSDITMLGGTITGGIIQTSTSGYRIRLNGSNNSLEYLNGNTVLSSSYADADGNFKVDATDSIRFSVAGDVRAEVGALGFYASSYRTGTEVGQTAQRDLVTEVGYDPKPPGVGNYYKFRTFYFTSGLLTEVSAESDMQAW